MRPSTAPLVKRLYEQRHAAELCIRCGQPVSDGKQRCLLCKQKADARNRAFYRRVKQQAAAEGTCTKCRRPRTGTVLVCEWHWLLNSAKSAMGSTSFALALKEKLQQQRYHCYYTGEILVPGVNASLDHRLPLASHPHLATDIDNVVWCTKSINSMKHDLDEATFIAMCRLVSEHADSLNACGKGVSPTTVGVPC